MSSKSNTESKIDSFLGLYRAGCDRLKTEPDSAAYYSVLDAEWARINQSDQSDKYLAAMHPDRWVIAIPQATIVKVHSSLPSWFSDATARNGTQLYFSSPGSDIYRIEIIRSLEKAAEKAMASHPHSFFDSIEFCVKWMLTRLERRIKYGWSGYCAKYFEGLQDQES